MRNASLKEAVDREAVFLFFGNDACGTESRTRGPEDRREIGRKKGSSLAFFTGLRFRTVLQDEQQRAGRKDIRYKMVTLDRTIEQGDTGSADHRVSFLLKATCWSALGRDRFPG